MILLDFLTTLPGILTVAALFLIVTYACLRMAGERKDRDEY